MSPYAIRRLRCWASRSWSSTQCMPRSRMALLSCMCCDSKRPFLRKMTFTDNSATDIAIINTLNSNVSVIFVTFAVQYAH